MPRKKRYQHLLGYVVGAIYPHDGQEWLFHRGDLCALWSDQPRSSPTIYKTVAAAEQMAKQCAARCSWSIFFRPYWLESPLPFSRLDPHTRKQLCKDRKPVPLTFVLRQAA